MDTQANIDDEGYQEMWKYINDSPTESQYVQICTATATRSHRFQISAHR